MVRVGGLDQVYGPHRCVCVCCILPANCPPVSGTSLYGDLKDSKSDMTSRDTGDEQEGVAAPYLSVLWGMVGSMDTMAPDASSRDRLVFLHTNNTHRFKVSCKPKQGPFRV